ncbi:MAG: glucose-6-phosphate isomerase [Thermodesulfobacteriota bacterium]|nr:glucose-6-phosphate isomerase [Thermodesulfobacteriota bacterium]
MEKVMNRGLDISPLGENRTILKQKLSHKKRSQFTPDDDFIKENRINLDITYILNPSDGRPFISRDELDKISPEVVEKHNQLKHGEGDCKDGKTTMLGWQSLPDEITAGHLDDTISAARELSNKIDAFVSLGIGGSYLGIEATFKALTHTFFNQLSREQRGNVPEIYFLGQNTDPDFFNDSLDMLDGKRVGINVISKSGTTTETAIAFRILRDLIEKWAGRRSTEFIFVTTDKIKGALKKLADKKEYKTFVVPDNVGGRFSVLTDVGLAGLALGGINIHEFAAGFRHMKKRVSSDDFWSNPAMIHAAVRHLSYKKGKKIEVVATNSTSIYHLGRWMEQLFPESEGHSGYGMWVSPSMYPEKLHANGQMVQDGERNILETFLRLLYHDNSLKIPEDPENLDGLNYLADSDMSFINRMAIDGPAYAHFQGGVPNMTIDIPRRNAFNIGQFYYMMEKSVALSGYLAGHNPFIQPGVEAYKKAIFAMAGKPGSEEYNKVITEAITRLNRTVI